MNVSEVWRPVPFYEETKQGKIKGKVVLVLN
jgi:hypothetical protein